MDPIREGRGYCQCVVLVDKEGGGGLMSERLDSFKWIRA